MKNVIAAGLGLAAFQLFRSRRRHELRGKVALVTGGSRGLGLAIARELGARGARLVICARTSEDLVWAKQDLEKRGFQVVALPCDVSKPAQVAQLVADAGAELDPIDIVVNNAGIITVGPIETMTRGDFEEVMAVSFWGTVNVTMAVLPGMRRRRSGHIVNVTSIGGKVAVPHLLAYDCAKFATQGFSEGLRAEVAKDGVCVTTVVPGLMRTGSPANATFKGNSERELLWFALGDATPVTAITAEAAARRIVRAIERGEGQVTLSWQAKLLRLAHALAPSLTTDTLGLVNRLLPKSGTADDRGVSGRELLRKRGWVRTLLAGPMREHNQPPVEEPAS